MIKPKRQMHIQVDCCFYYEYVTTSMTMVAATGDRKSDSQRDSTAMDDGGSNGSSCSKSGSDGSWQQHQRWRLTRRRQTFQIVFKV